MFKNAVLALPGHDIQIIQAYLAYLEFDHEFIQLRAEYSWTTGFLEEEWPWPSLLPRVGASFMTSSRSMLDTSGPPKFSTHML